MGGAIVETLCLGAGRCLREMHCEIAGNKGELPVRFVFWGALHLEVETLVLAAGALRAE